MADVGTLTYMDNSATTVVDPRVIEAMHPFFAQEYGNPSSIYRHGGRARSAMAAARAEVAEVLGARPTEIVFTSCGTESDNLALRGVALAQHRAGAPLSQGRHIITTTIEHSAVLRTCEQLARVFGIRVTYVPVSSEGLVDPDEIARAITPETVLVSVMYANNEVGTIEPLEEIARLARAKGVLVHTDAVQAGGVLDLDVNRLGVDLMSLSGHKLHGPKGVGALYVRQGTPLLPMQTGGGQERGLRAGTENVPYIVGFARALRLAHHEREAEAIRLRALRDRLISGVLSTVPHATLTGHPEQRLPGHASFCFAGVEGEALLLHLDLAGICASTGSACAAMEEEPSHVLLAMGTDVTLARGSLRLSMGRDNTPVDVERVLKVLPGIVEGLRAMSPLDTAHH